MSQGLIGLLESGLDGAYKRQELISNNIANVNTPNYKRQDISFKEALRKEYEGENRSKNRLSLNVTNKNHRALSSDRLSLNIETDSGLNYKNDKNNVDIDTEMVESTKNNLYYNTLTKQLNSKFDILRNVIERGGN